MTAFLIIAFALMSPTGGADSRPVSLSPRIQFLGAENFPNNAGCAGFPYGTSDHQSVFAWAAPSYFVVAKIDGRVLRLAPGPRTESHRQGGFWRRGDRLHQEWIDDRIVVILDLVVTSDCAPGEDCKGGTEYDGVMTVQVKDGSETKAQKTMRIQVDCGC
jgi:hypothetical protein